MIKTRFSSIVSRKYSDKYICYDSSIQQILEDRVLSSLDSGEFRLENRLNYLDLNNGFIKKHYWRKGGMKLLKDYYIYLGLVRTRPVRELQNYIDFAHIINKTNNDKVKNLIEICTPVCSFIEKKGILYTGDIVLSKIDGLTFDQYILNNELTNQIYNDLRFSFEILFQNGIYNIDMNLKNIIYNHFTNKISFIDFDKLVINTSRKNDKKYSSDVLRKFKKSLKNLNLDNRFNWKKFIK